MASENFPTNNYNEHLSEHDKMLLKADRIREDLKHIRIGGQDALRELSEEARAITGMAKMTLGMPTLNPIIVSSDDDEDDEQSSDS